MRKGFTLVEIAIVLVIIGLLIGGILAAQSMIETAKTNAIIKELQQIDIAARNFKTKYGGLPGDSASVTPSGDGDGIIEDGLMLTDGVNNSVGLNYELTNFWAHLQNYSNLTGFSPFAGAGDPTVNLAAFMPKVSYSGSNGNPSVISAYYNQSFLYKHYYYICSFGYGSQNRVFDGMGPKYPSHTPKQALALDAKLDDGNTGMADVANYSGSVISFGSVYGHPTDANALGTTFQHCTNDGEYNISYNEPACCTLIKMDSAQ